MLDTPQSFAIIRAVRGYSSVGRARPCQGRGHRFEPGYPLHIKGSERALFLFVQVKMAGWLSGYGGGLQILYSRVRFSPLPPTSSSSRRLSQATLQAEIVRMAVERTFRFISQFSLTIALQTALFAPLAGIAQLVERDLAKVEVTGSSPVTRSRLKDRITPLFYCKWLLTAGWLSGYGGGLQILYSRVRFSPLPPTSLFLPLMQKLMK